MFMISFYNTWSFKMFEVTKDDDYVSVTVVLQKRRLARESKIYFYYRDGLREAQKAFPDLALKQVPENSFVVSNVRAPHEGTWRFRILKDPKPNKAKFTKKEKTKNSDPDLTSSEKSATIEETNNVVKDTE